MSKLFNPEMMQWVDKPGDWKDVVHKGVMLLVQNNCATPKLADAIFQATAEHGAYYVLEKGIALLHAPPGDYALKAATSTLILANEVVFNNQPDKSARIIVTLSAPNSQDHIDLIVEFGKYFMNPELKEKLLNVENLQEFLKLVSLER